MSRISDESPKETAVKQLEALGLSAYAARTFVALVEHDAATAKSVSETADVPRTRVYDAAEELDEWGLVDIDTATPRRFVPVSVETARALLSEEFTCRIETLSEVLETIEADGDGDDT